MNSTLLCGRLRRKRKRFPFLRPRDSRECPMSSRDAAIALRRFGLGARSGELKRIAGDPRGFVLQSLTQSRRRADQRRCARAQSCDLCRRARGATPEETGRARRGDAIGRRRQCASGAGATTAARSARPAAEAAPDTAQPQATAPPAAKPGRIRREAFHRGGVARFSHAATTDAAFLERLVMFWSNHFCVSANKGPVRGIAGAYEREAIRPHVLGRFADMLIAVEQHPAMLIYLDNAQSIGPNSRAGLNRGRGLNENLAREILELHTLGVGGGYTPGGRHQPGPHPDRLDGRQSRQCGDGTRQVLLCPGAPRARRPDSAGQALSRRRAATGEEVLRDLAAHPATARHIARKLARHFVADDPPAALVQRLETTFLETGGDLAAVSKALVRVAGGLGGPARQGSAALRFSHRRRARLCARTPSPQEMLRLADQLGQPLWRPPAPAGWPDTDTAWAAPSALRERLRIAEVAARRADRRARPAHGCGGHLRRGHGPRPRARPSRAPRRASRGSSC